MQEYTIESLKPGMRASFSRTITAQMQQKFYDISGDENPLHTNVDHARERGFQDRVVYGMLTASLLSTLGGVYLPGKNCLIQGVEVKFAKPVFIGDELHVMGEVKRVDVDLRYAEIKVSIRNQEHEKVLRGLLKVGVLDG